MRQSWNNVGRPEQTRKRGETNPDRRWESAVWSPVVNTNTWGAHRRGREEEQEELQAEAGEV